MGISNIGIAITSILCLGIFLWRLKVKEEREVSEEIEVTQ